MVRYYDEALDVPLGQDFVRRKRHGRLSLMLAFFFAGICFATWIAINPILLDSTFTLALLIIAVLSVPTSYMLFNMQKNLDLVLGIEFQNALFSSVMNEQADFTVIVNHEGAVEYADKGFESYFPNVPRDNVMEAMISIGALSRSDTEKLYSALLHSHKEHFTFPVADEFGHAQRMRVNIIPLARPKGFFLWQGRKYAEDRSDQSAQQQAHQHVSLQYLQHVMSLQDTMPIGIYTAGAHGHILSNNHALEAWLGYEAGELVARQMGIRDLHYRPDSLASGTEQSYDHSFVGETLLRHKNGSLVKVMLRHYVSQDGFGNVIASYGVVENLSIL